MQLFFLIWYYNQGVSWEHYLFTFMLLYATGRIPHFKLDYSLESPCFLIFFQRQENWGFRFQWLFVTDTLPDNQIQQVTIFHPLVVGQQAHEPTIPLLNQAQCSGGTSLPQDQCWFCKAAVLQLQQEQGAENPWEQ